jgi:outer membrane protein TolC
VQRKHLSTGFRCAFLWVPLVAAGCTGNTRAQLERVKALKADVAEVERPPADGPRQSLTLPELIERALQRSPDVLRSELRALTDQADFDQFASDGLPRVGLDASYGRSAYLRRDESSGLRVAPALSWDVLRLLQNSRMKRFRARSERAGALGREIAREAVELEVVRRYVEWEAARTTAALARERAAVAVRQARIAELQGATASDSPTLEANAAAASRQIDASDGRSQFAETRLRSLCRLGANEQPVPNFAGLAPFDPPPLGEYLARVLAASEGVELAEVRAALADQRARATAAQRWTNFRFSTDAGNILDLLSSSPFAILTWSYSLIDQGDFNRQLIKARAEALLARLDRRDEADRLLDTAGRVWVALLDAAVDRRKAQDAQRVAMLAERVAAAQVADRVAPPAALMEADLNLAAAQADLRLRSLDHLLLSTQFRVLGGEMAIPLG